MKYIVVSIGTYRVAYFPSLNVITIAWNKLTKKKQMDRENVSVVVVVVYFFFLFWAMRVTAARARVLFRNNLLQGV